MEYIWPYFFSSPLWKGNKFIFQSYILHFIQDFKDVHPADICKWLPDLNQSISFLWWNFYKNYIDSVPNSRICITLAPQRGGGVRFAQAAYLAIERTALVWCSEVYSLQQPTINVSTMSFSVLFYTCGVKHLFQWVSKLHDIVRDKMTEVF